MQPLYKSLQKIFGHRIISNEEIPVYMRNLIQTGKFDEPKKNALLIELMLRVVELEKENDPEFTLKDKIIDSLTVKKTQMIEELKNAAQPMSWNDLRLKAKELGVFDKTLKRPELEALVASKQ